MRLYLRFRCKGLFVGRVLTAEMMRVAHVFEFPGMSYLATDDRRFLLLLMTLQMMFPQ
jgi:hypothetical protein